MAEIGSLLDSSLGRVMDFPQGEECTLAVMGTKADLITHDIEFIVSGLIVEPSRGQSSLDE